MDTSHLAQKEKPELRVLGKLLYYTKYCFDEDVVLLHKLSQCSYFLFRSQLIRHHFVDVADDVSV